MTVIISFSFQPFSIFLSKYLFSVKSEIALKIKKKIIYFIFYIFIVTLDLHFDQYGPKCHVSISITYQIVTLINTVKMSRMRQNMEALSAHQ